MLYLMQKAGDRWIGKTKLINSCLTPGIFLILKVGQSLPIYAN